MKIRGNIVSSSEAFYGELIFDQTISAITKIGQVKKDSAWVYPGFIDLHVHGGGGHDIMEGEQAIRHTLRAHARHGTTSLLATTVTESSDKLNETFENIKKVEVFYLPKQRPAGTDELQLLSLKMLLFTFNGSPFALLMSTPLLSSMLFEVTTLSRL